MAQQWGVNTGQPSFQYPMQTGFQPNPNLQQFQQQTPAALAPQPTGFPAQRPQFQQPQQTGYPTMNMGGIQPQVTGYPMQSMGFQQQVPPVPPLPSGFGAQRAPPPPPPQRSFLSPSPGLTPQMTGFPGAPVAPLVPQVTGYTDPRLLMMSNTFMPANPSMPFSGSGAPQFAGIPQSGPGAGAGSLVQSMQQYNQETQSAPPKMQWALTRAEKKQYDQIFRSWDSQGTGFISGQMALEVFGQSGLEKNDLAKIWALADADNRGKLNLAEFHVAMGLIYRKLNGLPIPDQLPPELVPPSSRDLDTSVNFLKDILKNDTSRPGSADAISRGKVRSFNDSSPVGGGGRKDGTVYRYTDDNDGGSVYQSRSRHIDRRNVRVGNESPGEDLETMRRQLENAARTLEKSDEEQRNRTREDEELEREMEDLRYRVKRIQEDLEYVSRGPRSTAKDEERRKLERDLMHLMHERIPEVQRKQEERERRKEREKREWNRDRDRRNERFGRYDDRDREHDEGYNRGTYDRDRSRDRRDRDYERDRDRDRDRDYDHSYGRDRDWDRDRNRERDRPRSPPVNARSPPPPPPAASATAPSVPPAPPKPSTTPAPSMKNMSADERAAYIREQAQLKLQERMRALGVVTPAPSSGSPASPTVDTTVEDRLAREKKEAEEKALQAEKDAEERERIRKERLENERALKEGRATTPVAPATPPVPPVASATVKAAPPPPPIGQKRPPPPPVKRGQAPRPPVVSPAPPPPAPPVVPIAPAPAEVDPEEEMLREREERLRKQREAREARLRQLEQEEEEARKAEEEYQKRRAEFQKQQQAPIPAVMPPTPAETQAQSPPPPPPPPPIVLPNPSLESSAVGTPGEKHSTNPFSKFMSQGNGSVAATTPTSSTSTGSTNPFFKPQQPAATISSTPTPTVAPFKPPTPMHSSVPPPVKTSYQTAPTDDDDWGKELDDDDDSSDDEIATSRNARDMLAQQLFGSSASRPQSAAGSHPVKSQTPTPGPLSAPLTSAPTLPPAPPPPPPAPPADAISTFTPPAPPQPPVAPPPPAAIAAPVAAGAGDRSALMGSILAGTRLRKAVTNDRSAASVSGSVVGDSAPPEHILNAPRPVSPPAPSANPYTQEGIAPSTPSIPVAPEGDVRVNHRQSVDWYAGLAADQGVLNPLPPTIEENEPEEERTTIVPAIQVDEPPTEDATDLLDDVDKSKEYRVRTLYSYEAQRPEDLSFSENIIISANPSKSGGAWWYGKNAKTGKSGFFPSTYVQELGNIKAKALYSYTGENPDELPFVEGDTLTIVDQSEADWWKTEQGGVIFIVPAAYFEVIEGDCGSTVTGQNSLTDKENVDAAMTNRSHETQTRIITHHEEGSGDADKNEENSFLTTDLTMGMTLDTSNSADAASRNSILSLSNPEVILHLNEEETSDEEYHSFESDTEDDNEDGVSGLRNENSEKKREYEAREMERRRVLEAAGLIVKASHADLREQRDMNEQKEDERPKSMELGDASENEHSNSNQTIARRRRRAAPPPPQTPNRLSVASLYSDKDLPQTPVSMSSTHEEDAFDRYDAYRLKGTSSIDTQPPSPGHPPLLSTASSRDKDANTTSHSISFSSHSHSHSSASSIFGFLTRSKTPDSERPRLQISGPITSSSSSTLATDGTLVNGDNGSIFGTSWASLIDKDALDDIPDEERKRQEAIFELINTEAAYVRDLQLIVNVFFSNMIKLLTEEEILIVFANIEDLLLTNTSFLSSLEERQKDCRLYINNIGDLLEYHMRNMKIYSEYCTNQAHAIDVLQSIRDERPNVADRLQKLKEDPSVRNLDLSSYLLAPMQRLTRYPLLIRQIRKYTVLKTDKEDVERALKGVERTLRRINDSIKDREGRARLEAISKNLYAGQARLNLAKCTGYMGPRKLIKEGPVNKYKSGRKLCMFLCNDMIFLTNPTAKRLYKMPIELNQVEVKELESTEELGFQLVFSIPRGGEAMKFKVSNAKDCQAWIKAINKACMRAKDVGGRRPPYSKRPPS